MNQENGVKVLREPRYSHADALSVTGLTAEQLLTWHKRGVLSNKIAEAAAGGKGRGVRRKYCLLDLWHLTVMREMTEAAVPVLLSSLIAIYTFSIFKFLLDFHASTEDLNPIVIAVFRVDGELRYDLIHSSDLHSWMHEKRLRKACFVDLVAIYRHMTQNLLELKQNQ